jgi:hypothetical protein
MEIPVHEFERYSRRDVLKKTGIAAGALGLGLDPLFLASAAEPPNTFPQLNERARGWLRFLYEKATTKDDWSSKGKPNEWWDQYTAPGIFSYPRFDLSESTYAVIMMADQTPAWREVYSRIMDELAGRYVTYWGAIDWMTQIGDDPARANYPPQVMALLPPNLRGKYNRVGWVANGIEPYGLSPDPLAADGNLFYRGWFNLIASAYDYVSGDDKWRKPFKIIGYQDREFEWTLDRVVQRLNKQWGERPEGIHCENTKIWPFCLSAAGLGLHLYDRLHGTRMHAVAESWFEYFRHNYMGLSADGKLAWSTFYYDPVVNFKLNQPQQNLGTLFYMLPQIPELAAFLYKAAVAANGWDNPNTPVRGLSYLSVVLSREMGDETSYKKLSAAAEQQFEPRFFGEDSSDFGWWFKLGEKFPRGQQSALMMVSQVGKPGDWSKAFTNPHPMKLKAPTVEGIDFPAVGISQAWNDAATGTLNLTTYAATPSRRGAPTTFRVTKLPNARKVKIFVDGQPYKRFHRVGPDTIQIESTIDLRQYSIVTGYHPGVASADTQNEPAMRGSKQNGTFASASLNSASASSFLASAPSCPCCGKG